MALIQRVQDILLKPKETWPAVSAEPADTAAIYTGYVMILAAIGPIASFIGLSLIGFGGFGVSVRVPIMMGLIHLIVSYVLTLVAVFVLALIVNALAPTFGGTKNQINALKLVAYSMTASFLGGIFGLIPMLGILAFIAALYSIYLFYTGVPVLMKCPQEKAPAYTVVVIVIGIVAGIILGALSGLVMGGGAMMAGGMMPGRHMGSATSGGDVTIRTPGGEVSINTSKMEEMAKKMEAASKQMEIAQAKGDSAAAGKAMGEMMGAMVGGGGVPIPAQDLKALLPESIGEMKRESLDVSGGQAMGIAASVAKASYAAGDKRVQLTLTDMGGLGGLAGLAAWANVTSDRETNDEIEKVYKQGNRTVREEARKDGSHAEVTTITENGIIVEARGERVDLNALKSVIQAVGLEKLEAMKRVAKQ
ncbi:MAG TPA: Yip1 family protein [Albitalea sp.]|nr:Yip1 family protein [Albitalea sp.]